MSLVNDFFRSRIDQMIDLRLPLAFRQLIGEEGVEELLSYTVAAAQNMKFVSKKQMETVVVDSTVQHKAVGPPKRPRG